MCTKQHKMKKKIFATDHQLTGFFVRLVLGLLLLPHGLQKTLGLFGGYGFTGTMGYFTGVIHLPWILGAFIIVIESLGALLLIAGLATRFWALMVIALMLGTIITVHGSNGFFMDWGGTLNGEGYEYHLAIIALALISFFQGGGRYSLDHQIARS